MAKRTAKPTANLTPWERGESGNPNGRPRQVLRLLEEKAAVEFNVSLSRQDKLTILESLLELPIPELKRIAADTQAPAFVVMVAKAIVSDASKGSLNVLSQLFDRLYGKPKQASEIVSDFKGFTFNGFDFLEQITGMVVE